MHRVVVVRLIRGLATPRKFDLPSPAIVVVWTKFLFISGAAKRHGGLIRRENMATLKYKIIDVAVYCMK